MNLKHYYWYFQSALPNRLCNDILEYGKKNALQTAVTGTDVIENLTEEQLKNIQLTRKSEVVWLNDQWIYNEIYPYLKSANENAGWNFEYSWSESCQFTKYSVGNYYGWHCDSHENPYIKDENDPLNGKIRKLSMTISLSDPDEYEGGNLEFDFRNTGGDEWVNKDSNNINNYRLCTEIRPRGSIVVFPSFVWHRVTPVTKGTRYSLVVWTCGQPYK